MSGLIFIGVLGLLVFVHELGHFLAARRAGVGVLEFGFGFPPRLWSVQRGPTRWSINLIPFGGFVRLEGETDASVTTSSSFATASVSKKIIILAAGVIMNYVLAWVLLSGALIGGVTVDPTSLSKNQWQQLSETRAQALVSADGQAAAAGLRTGDQIVTVNNQKFFGTQELIDFTQAAEYPNLQFVVIRNGQEKKITVQPIPVRETNRPVYGLAIQPLATLRYPAYIAPVYGLITTVTLTGQTFTGFGQLIGDLFTQGRVSEDLAGPVGIAILTGQVSELGWIAILQFVAILSISLAVINFLPLPALDGGRAAFAVLERLRGRPFNPRWEQTVHAAGFYLLLLAILLISIRDVRRFELLERIVGWFQS